VIPTESPSSIAQYSLRSGPRVWAETEERKGDLEEGADMKKVEEGKEGKGRKLETCAHDLKRSSSVEGITVRYPCSQVCYLYIGGTPYTEVTG
jgi:hypothetical protein